MRLRKTIVGVELTESAVKWLALAKIHDDIWVEGFAIANLPHGVIVDQQIKDIQGVINVLKPMRQALPRWIRNAVIALPSQCVQSKIIQVAATPLASYVDHSLVNKYWDYAVLGPSDKDNYVDVLIVTTPAEYVDVRIDILAEVGFKTRIVDIDHYAAARVKQIVSSTKSNPLQSMNCRDDVDQQQLQELTEELMICCGLALRGLNDEC